ncbi:MAG: hypothetical protein WDN10_00170 [bacterium]
MSSSGENPPRRFTASSFKGTPLNEEPQNIQTGEPAAFSQAEAPAVVNAGKTADAPRQEIEAALRFRLKEGDSPDIRDLRKDTYEELMELADDIRGSGREPGDMEEWRKAYREYEKFNDMCDKFTKANDAEAAQMGPNMQKQYDLFIRRTDEAYDTLTKANVPSEEAPTPAVTQIPGSPGPGSKPLGDEGYKSIPPEKKDEIPPDTAPVEESDIDTDKGVGDDMGRDETAAPPEVDPVIEREKLKENIEALNAAEAARWKAENPSKEETESKVPEDSGTHVEDRPAPEKRPEPGSMAEHLAQVGWHRDKTLDREATEKLGSGSKAFNWWKQNAEDYNGFRFRDKLVLGAVMTVVGFGATVVIGLPGAVAAALALPFRLFTSSATGLGAGIATDALIQRSAYKKDAAGKGLGYLTGNTRNRKIAAGAIGTATGVATFFLGQWLSGVVGNWLGHAPGVEAGAGTPNVEHHFDPKAMIEVQKGHGAISMIEDLKEHLRHLYEHTDPSKIPAGAKAVLGADPTKLAEQLQAYQPGESLNSQLIPEHAHLGIGQDGSLMYSADGVKNPLTLIDGQGHQVASWNDHMMRPGAHPAPSTEAQASQPGDASASDPNSLQYREMEMSKASHGDLVPDARGVGHPASEMGGSERLAAHSAPAPALETASSNLTSNALHTLQEAAPGMQPDPTLTQEILSANAKDINAYLLHDGRVSVFGGSPALYEQFAKNFAGAMRTDVVLPVNQNGTILDYIIHPDGTSELVTPKSPTPIVEQLVMKLAK